MSLLENRLFFILALFFTIIVAAGTSFLVLRFFAFPAPEAEDVELEEARELGVIYEFGEFTVNLAEADSRRFLRTFVVMELSHSRVEGEMEKREHQIRDRIIRIIRGKMAKDLAQEHQILELKEEILGFINPLLTNGKVLDLWFTDFVIQ